MQSLTRSLATSFSLSRPLSLSLTQNPISSISRSISYLPVQEDYIRRMFLYLHLYLHLHLSPSISLSLSSALSFQICYSILFGYPLINFDLDPLITLLLISFFYYFHQSFFLTFYHISLFKLQLPLF
jgi:hypothetical protein